MKTRGTGRAHANKGVVFSCAPSPVRRTTPPRRCAR
jgi:hypothetical protein